MVWYVMYSTIVFCVLIQVMAVITQESPLGASNTDQEDRSFVALIASKVNKEYTYCFLQVETEETIIKANMALNGITNVKDIDSKPPNFVKGYEEILS